MNTPKTPKLFVFVSLLVLATLVLTACGAVASPSEAQVACGDLGVKSYTKDGFECNSAAPEPTQESVPTTAAQATLAPTQGAPAQPAVCEVINDYQLKDLTEISSQPGSLIHVEWYTQDGQPEYESVLPSGRYTVDKPFPGGHVWEFSPACSVDQVLSDNVAPHIQRRLENKANNKGYRPWEDLVEMGFITQITSTSDVVVPSSLP